MGNNFESKEQIKMPTENNALDYGREKARVERVTPKAANFKKGPLETPGIPGNFKDRSAVNPAKNDKFSAKRPSGL